MKRRRSTQARVIETDTLGILRPADPSPGSNETAGHGTTPDATNQPALVQDPVLAFNCVDERFIDFLVEEALKEWRAKNF